MHGLCRMYKPQMKADKGSPSRGGHNKNPCISLRSSGFSNPSSRPRNPVAGRRGRRRGALAAAAVHAHRSRRHGVAELPVHTGTQTQIRCWNCCQSWSQSRLETDSEYCQWPWRPRPDSPGPAEVWPVTPYWPVTQVQVPVAGL